MNLLNNKKYLISPSILAADFSDLQNEFIKLQKAGIKYIHYDVMDNNFVPQLTFGYKFINDYNKKTELLADVHLMINSPHLCFEKYIEAGSDLLTFHIETLNKDDIELVIKKLKQENIKIGLSIKPDTKTDEILPYLDLIDLVLIMTVEPGFAGQSLIENCLPKISSLREIIEKKNLNTVIQVDGGINLQNIKEIYERGCTFFVMGSAFFKEKDYNALMDRIDYLLLK
jgi:ribulose-phosphate 3-epimerase